LSDVAAKNREPGPDQDESWVRAIQAELAAWYQGARRALPWRADRDPYRILVSEFMLVQTTVAAVIPFYERFLGLFPTIESLARADEASVLKAWEGLGYYRRARQLHAAARRVVQQHKGTVPHDPAAVRALPGVGRYIAGALLSFAFDRPEPIVEANSRRVLARLVALREGLEQPGASDRIWLAAQRLVPHQGAGAFNQALMDLGALVCTPRRPRCLYCPLSALCLARTLGIQDIIPPATQRPRPLGVTESCAIVARQGEVLIVQRPPGGLWEEFWEFPTVHIDGADPAGRSFGAAVDLAEGLRRLTGIRAEVGPAITTVRFSVTKHRVTLTAHRATTRSSRLGLGHGLKDARWVEPASLGNYTFGSGGRRLIAWLARFKAWEYS
jgi:A/G-specific adenine glycosylase